MIWETRRSLSSEEVGCKQSAPWRDVPGSSWTAFLGERMRLTGPLDHLAEPAMEIALFRKSLWKTLLSDGVEPPWHTWGPTRCSTLLHQQKHCQLGLKGTERGQNVGRRLDFWDSTGGASWLQTRASLREKVGWLWGQTMEMWVQRR